MSLSSGMFYLMAIEPLYDIYVLIKAFNYIYIIYLLLDIVIYGFAFYYTYKLASGRYYMKRIR